MKTIKAWYGDTISLTATEPDDTALTATLIVGEPGDAPVYMSAAVPFVDGVADLTITDESNTILVGSYNYMVRVDYTGGAELTFPAPSDCDPSELPQFIIEEPVGVVS